MEAINFLREYNESLDALRALETEPLVRAEYERQKMILVDKTSQSIINDLGREFARCAGQRFLWVTEGFRNRSTGKHTFGKGYEIDTVRLRTIFIGVISPDLKESELFGRWSMDNQDSFLVDSFPIPMQVLYSLNDYLAHTFQEVVPNSNKSLVFHLVQSRLNRDQWDPITWNQNDLATSFLPKHNKRLLSGNLRFSEGETTQFTIAIGDQEYDKAMKEFLSSNVIKGLPDEFTRP